MNMITINPVTYKQILSIGLDLAPTPCCLSDIFSSGDALPVRLQAVGQLPRAAEGDEVPAGHLVEGNAQTFSHDSALEFHREEAVVAALQEPRWHLGPLRQGPWLLKRRAGLV